MTTGEGKGRTRTIELAAVNAALPAAGTAALLVNIHERKQEARHPFYRLVTQTEETADPSTAPLSAGFCPSAFVSGTL